MVGGRFEAASNADFTADLVELHTVAEPPTSGYTTLDLAEPIVRRYVRYIPPPNSMGNIAEMEVRGFAPGTVLEQQVARMLADGRARALTDYFAARWLQLVKLPTARPSTEFFPDFNGNIRQAMYDETTTFFDALRRDNRSLAELLDADYTYLNEELARYYGIPGISGKPMQRSCAGARASPGRAVGDGQHPGPDVAHFADQPHAPRQMDFGSHARPPPPPPANVSQIADERDKSKEAATFREKLAQHSTQAACAACHRKMDPLGFALDHYNAVGIWRDKAGDRPLDVSGELPGGEKLNGEADLKRVLLARKTEFIRNLTEQLLSFALGRQLDYYDDGPVDEIVARLKADDDRFATLVLGIVQSYPFTHRKNPPATP